jgi:L-fuconolactonase
MTGGLTLTRSMTELDTWLARHVEEVLEPDLPIVDAHHHMWWRPPEAYQHTEMVEDIRAGGHAITHTVFVQCNAMYRSDGPEAMRPIGETEYINGIAAISASGMFGDLRLCAAIVGFAELQRGDAVAEVLEAHIAVGGGRFRGIRQQAQYDPVLGAMARIAPPQGLLDDAAFRRGFARLAPLGLSFDAWIYFIQLGDLARLAEAFPDTIIILNHIGAPLGIGPYADRRDEVFGLWASAIADLARRPNVICKLGGMGMALHGFGFADHDRPLPSTALADAWRPYIEHCIEAFGPARCMFESNFPVDRQACSYRTLWNAFKHITAGCSAEEKNALFSDTASRVYRL